LKRLNPDNPEHLHMFVRNNIKAIQNHKVEQTDEFLNSLDGQQTHELIFKELQQYVDDLEDLAIDHMPWQINVDDTYNPTYFMNYDKEHTGIRGDRVMEQIYLDLEMIMEEAICKPRREKGSLAIKKGETKLW